MEGDRPGDNARGQDPQPPPWLRIAGDDAVGTDLGTMIVTGGSSAMKRRLLMQACGHGEHPS
jgi:hypothetical protein